MKRTICAILTLALLLCLCPAVSFASGEALSLTWSQGTYYDGKINPNLVSRKYAVIDVSEGDVVTFDYPSANWAIYVYYEKAQGTYGYVTSRQGSNESFVVEAIDGWVPTQLQLTAFHRSGSNVTITDELWSTFDVTVSKTGLQSTGKTFTFATQNVGLWNDGVTQGVAADKVEARAAAWQAEMAEHDIDILVGQEWQPYLDSDKTVDANEKVFGGQYPYMFGQNTTTYDGKSIISRTPLTDITYTAQVSNVGRRYAKAYTFLGGKKVCIINAHLSFEEDINTNRKEEMVELLNLAQSERYAIIAGDFNVFTADEFKLFEEAGYSLANAGAFGQFNTWPNLGRNPTADVNRVIDNIIVSPGIRINSVQVDDHQLSDHALLVANLTLLEEGEFTDERLKCEHCGQFVTWKPITFTNGGTANAFRESGHYYLTQDLVKVNSQFYVGVLNEATPDVVIDLRGHAVKSTGRVFYVRKNSKLTIVDTVGCGTVSGASTGTGGCLYVEVGCRFAVHNGSFYSTGNPTTDRKGGLIYAETGATIVIDGGELYAGAASHGGILYGGNQNPVTVSGGTLYGGQVKTAGGAIYMSAGTLEITGGTIQGGSSNNGGAIYMGGSSNSAGTLKLYGGTVTGGTGAYGGNIHAGDSTTVELGNCDLYGGTATGSGKDLYLAATTKLKVLKTFSGTVYMGTNVAHRPETTPGSTLATTLDSCEGYFPGQLFLENISGAPAICGVDGDTALYIASARLVRKDGSVHWYANNTAMVAAYEKETAPDYLVPAPGELTLAGNAYTLDLAGQDIILAGSGTVRIFDSANRDFTTYGTARLASGAAVTVANAQAETFDDVYYMVCDEDGYSFHRLAMEIVGVSLRPSVGGMYYTGKWQCDGKLASHVDTHGVAVSLVDMPAGSLDASQDRWTSFTTLVSGEEKCGVMVKNIMKTPEEAPPSRVELNARYGALPVFATAYVTIDGTTYFAEEDGQASFSLKSLLEAIDAKITEDPEAYATHIPALQALYEKYPGMEQYTFQNFGK